MTSLLLHTTDLEPEDLVCSNSKESFSLLQIYIDPLYYSKPIEKRFIVAMSLALRNAIYQPETFLLALGNGPTIPAPSLQMTDGKNQTLLHVVAWNIGQSRMEAHNSLHSPNEFRFPGRFPKW